MGWLTRSPGEAPTKQFFIHSIDGDGTLTTTFTDHRTRDLPNSGNPTIFFEFFIPDDFTSLSEAVLVCQGAAGASGDVLLTRDASWGGVGEAANATSDGVTSTAITITQDVINEVGLSAALTGIAAGDYVGLKVNRTAGGGGDTFSGALEVLGIMVKYT